MAEQRHPVDPKRERAIRRNLSMTRIQAAGDLRDELVEDGIPKEVADQVYGAALLTPELLEEQRIQNIYDSIVIDIRERSAPGIFYPPFELKWWERILLPFYRPLRNIWRRLR